MPKIKGNTRAAITAVMKYAQAIEIIEWLDNERAYCGGNAEDYAFWFAVRNPTLLNQEETEFVARVLFWDDRKIKARVIEYCRQQLSGR